MKKFFRSLLLMLSIILSTDLSNAQWVQSDGPYSGDIKCLTASGAYIFAGTSGAGIFRLTKKDSSWTGISSGITNMYIDDIVLTSIGGDSTYIFAGTKDGVFRSSDNGDNWVNSGLDNTIIKSLYIVENGTDSVYLFAGSRGNGVFLSTDYGNNWTPVNTGLPSFISIDDFASIHSQNSTDLFVSVEANGVYHSTNNGLNWSVINSGLTSTNISGFAACDTTLFVGTFNGVFRSTNKGANWEQTTLPDYTVLGIDANQNSVFVSMLGGGLFYSVDDGKSWIAIYQELHGKDVSSVVVSDSDLYAGTWAGVFISTNNGVNWNGINKGLNASIVHALSSNGTNYFAGCSDGFYLSTNSGESWFIQKSMTTGWNTELTTFLIHSFAVNGTTLFAGSNGGGILRSNDNGMSWTPVNTGLVFHSDIISLLVIPSSGETNETRIFAGTSEGVFCSTNNGDNWIPVNAGLTTSIISDITLCGSNLFAATVNGGVFRSTNYGTNWTAVNTGLSTLTTYCITGLEENIFVGTEEHGIFRSTNNGDSWTEINNDLGANIVYELVMVGTNIFAGTNRGVFLSTNNGMNWICTDFVNVNVIAFAVCGTNIFAGTAGCGVWQRQLSEIITGVENIKNQIPAYFTLAQNYPNPFNPSTVINYQLSAVSNVKLTVYDVLGREIAVLVEGKQNAGTHQTQWNAEGFPSGVYFYRLDAGNHLETRKLVLLK